MQGPEMQGGPGGMGEGPGGRGEMPEGAGGRGGGRGGFGGPGGGLTVPDEYDFIPIWGLSEAKLIAMVKDSKSTEFQKAIACKKLGWIGGSSAIEPMAALLSDEHLNDYARFGMEPNPDPAVDKAFRAALTKLSGNQLVGVVQSIGVREDAGALDAVAKLIDSSDEEVAKTAAATVGMIGGTQALKILEDALKRTKEPVFPVVARAALLCTEKLMESNRARALESYQSLTAENLPEPVRLGALRVLTSIGPAPAGVKKYPPPADDEEA